MASADWTDAASSLSTSSVRRSVTAGFTRPPGGGTFLYGFASVDASPGVVARYCTLSGTVPTSKGGDISCAMQRGAQSAEKTGFAAFLFFCLGGTDVSANAYMLGLADGDPCHLVLRKGALNAGLPDVPAPGQGVLARSTDTFSMGVWYQIKLEVVVNLNNDVVLNVYASDLGAHLVSAPVWAPVAGMAQFVDDALGVNSGSIPYLLGRLGYGFASSAIGRVAMFDEIRPTTQI